MISDSDRQLYRAIQSGDDSLAIRLLSENPGLENVMYLSDSWLHEAAESGRSAVIQKLLSLGVDVNSTESTFGSTALSYAVSEGHVQCVEVLLKHGARVSLGTISSDALWSAIVKNRLDLVQLLFQYDADPTVTYTHGWRVRNALNRAVELGHSEILQFMMNKGFVPLENTRAVSDLEMHLAPMFGQWMSVESVMEYLEPRIGVLSNPNALTLFTDGLSSTKLNISGKRQGHPYVELIMHLPPNWDLAVDTWPVEWLEDLAFNAADEKTWFPGDYSIVSNGEPPQPLSSDAGMSCWLLSAVPAKWGRLTTQENRSIQLFNVCPVFSEEREFEKKFGLAKLFEQFERHNVTTMVVKSRINVGLQK